MANKQDNKSVFLEELTAAAVRWRKVYNDTNAEQAKEYAMAYERMLHIATMPEEKKGE